MDYLKMLCMISLLSLTTFCVHKEEGREPASSSQDLLSVGALVVGSPKIKPYNIDTSFNNADSVAVYQTRSCTTHSWGLAFGQIKCNMTTSVPPNTTTYFTENTRLKIVEHPGKGLYTLQNSGGPNFKIDCRGIDINFEQANRCFLQFGLEVAPPRLRRLPIEQNSPSPDSSESDVQI